jgi:hypothetical protein
MTCGLGLVVITAPVAAQDTVAASAADATPVEAPKKKKSLFGKIKSIAADKTVQSVAKMAACTMVPGGQYVAGAIDAASSAADGNAAGAASGAAGAATGSNCFGGMGAAPGGTTSAFTAASAQLGGAAAAAMASQFNGAAPDAAVETDGSQFVLTEKQEKQLIKQMKKAGMTEEQAREQLAVYRQQMASPGASADE